MRLYKAEYFSDIVGVAKIEENKPQKLSLMFPFKGADEDWNKTVHKFYKLLESNPFYPNFKFKEYDDRGEASAVVRKNYELENNLLMYAHTAYISDEDIRESILKRARRILSTQNL